MYDVWKLQNDLGRRQNRPGIVGDSLRKHSAFAFELLPRNFEAWC